MWSWASSSITEVRFAYRGAESGTVSRVSDEETLPCAQGGSPLGVKRSLPFDFSSLE